MPKISEELLFGEIGSLQRATGPLEDDRFTTRYDELLQHIAYWSLNGDLAVVVRKMPGDMHLYAALRESLEDQRSAVIDRRLYVELTEQLQSYAKEETDSGDPDFALGTIVIDQMCSLPMLSGWLELTQISGTEWRKTEKTIPSLYRATAWLFNQLAKIIEIAMTFVTDYLTLIKFIDCFGPRRQDHIMADVKAYLAGRIKKMWPIVTHFLTVWLGQAVHWQSISTRICKFDSNCYPTRRPGETAWQTGARFLRGIEVRFRTDSVPGNTSLFAKELNECMWLKLELSIESVAAVSLGLATRWDTPDCMNSFRINYKPGDPMHDIGELIDPFVKTLTDFGFSPAKDHGHAFGPSND